MIRYSHLFHQLMTITYTLTLYACRSCILHKYNIIYNTLVQTIPSKRVQNIPSKKVHNIPSKRAMTDYLN